MGIYDSIKRKSVYPKFETKPEELYHKVIHPPYFPKETEIEKFKETLKDHLVVTEVPKLLGQITECNAEVNKCNAKAKQLKSEAQKWKSEVKMLKVQTEEKELKLREIISKLKNEINSQNENIQ